MGKKRAKRRQKIDKHQEKLHMKRAWDYVLNAVTR